MQTKWNLCDLYSSNEDLLSDLEETKTLLETLCKFKGKLKKADKKTLKRYFQTDEKFSLILEKMAVYVHTKHDDNAKDELASKNHALINNFFVKLSEKLSFVKPELASLSEKFLNGLKREPDFQAYSRTIDYLLRSKKHTLPEEKESMLATISGFSMSDEIYDMLSDIEMNHGTVVTDKGEEIKLSTGNYNLLLKSENQKFRKKVMETYLAEYGKLNMTYAGLYISHIKHNNFVAALRGFSSCLEMETYYEEVESSIMLKNIEYVSKKVELLREFFRLKKQILKQNSFYTSDISASLKGKTISEDYESAISDIRSSFSLLGSDYQEMFDKALNDGWIDAFPRENKASGGYTISNYTCHPYILLNYDGTAYWKSAIAHEFGHAMHSYYSCAAQPYPKADYTIFVAEVASLTNEILLTNHLLKKEKNARKKMQIICDFLGTFYLNVFNSTMLAEFEQYAHDSLWQGGVITATDLNKKFVSLCDKYFGDSVVLTKGYEYDWQRKSHIFRDYYLYKYSTGFIAASAVANKIINDKSGEYREKYKNFLSLGGSLPPQQSLLRAEIDINSEETYSFAFNLFEKYLNELKSLMKEKIWL